MKDDTIATVKESSGTSRKRKRSICDRCKKPSPQACICSALPETPITLQHSRVIVLQHPHERKRKNSSIPLISLCLDQSMKDADTDDFDFSFYTVTGRYLGEEIVLSSVWKMINDPNEPVYICYPNEDAVSLKELLSQESVASCRELGDQNCKRINIKPTFIFIDATWAHAKEMFIKTKEKNGWPKHAINIKLNPTSDNGKDFQARRFDIRTPPSPDHLSTAECIATVLRELEGESNKDIFDLLMRPLDLMVSQWRSKTKDKMTKTIEHEI